MSVRWYRGNASEDGKDTRGWLLGHFLDSSAGVRATKDVEVKWGIHPAGDKRPEWTGKERRTALLILITGRFVVHFDSGSAELSEQGDYVVWGPGTDHTWEAKEDSVVLTVRWPSEPSPA